MKALRFLFTALQAAIGLSACGQENFENANVAEFAKLADEPNVVVLDVRTVEEYAEGHIVGALNIDQGQGDFMEKAKAQLPSDKTIAVYCRSGRRSASAASRLAAEGYTCVNLKGGIVAWKEAGLDVTKDNYEVDVFRTKNGKTVKFHALVHASIRIEYDGLEIMVDPVTKLGNRTIDYSTMPKADCILVTHEHADHFDKEAIRLLMGGNTRLIMNKRCVEMYGAGDVMANGQISDELRVTSDKLQSSLSEPCSARQPDANSASKAGAQLARRANGQISDKLQSSLSEPCSARQPDANSASKAGAQLARRANGQISDKLQSSLSEPCSARQPDANSASKAGAQLARRANGQWPMVNEIALEAVPAYNTTEGHLQFHPKGRDNGYILTLDGLRIYIAGDTEDIPEMSDIKDIDIAFLPCNQPYTMTPEQLVRAAKVIKPKVLFPYHYGNTDVSTIPAKLEGEGIDVRIRHYE